MDDPCVAKPDSPVEKEIPDDVAAGDCNSHLIAGNVAVDRGVCEQSEPPFVLAMDFVYGGQIVGTALSNRGLSSGHN